MILMLIVTACYTVTSLSDKYAVAKLKMDGNTLTWLMAAATSLFMLAYLPFDSRLFTLSWQSFAAIALMVLSKLLEFKLSAIVLKEMSAFELKAWLGITVFFSYITDLVGGSAGTAAAVVCRFAFIAATAAGLFMIARSGGEKINYRKIMLPLAGYLLAKFGYGLIVNFADGYISPTLSLFIALVILTAALAPAVRPIKLFKEKTKGAVVIALTKIPNVIGLVLENAIAAQSMANYSFIQPMILAALFFIGIIRREQASKLNIAGGIVCIAGVIGFQAVPLI